MKILHITAHMGGGIGTVITGVCIRDRANHHSILCLEESLDRKRLDECIAGGIPVYQYQNDDMAVLLLRQFDIVQVEWWHHPLMARFMVNCLSEVETRLVVWSHISGCNFPMIPRKFVSYPDSFIFATPFSYDNPFWTEEERKQIRESSFMVVSSGNDFSATPPPKRKHDGFVVGYVGFLGYEKTSPDFVKICESCAGIPGIRFQIVGNPQYGKELCEDVKKSSCASLFEFCGFSTNVAEELAGFDLFACLLWNEHTGASENALLEAMYAGVCPVVFKQCTEQYLVRDGETGIVCKDIEEFQRAVAALYQDPERRELLAGKASGYVREHYSIENTVNLLGEVYENTLKKEKRLHDGSAVFGHSPCEWFFSCYGGDKEHIRGLADGKSKGSVHQYYKYFPTVELEYIIQNYTESRKRS